MSENDTVMTSVEVDSYVEMINELQLNEDLSGVIDAFNTLYEKAYEAYLPLVEDLCSRDASENEVEFLLDRLFDFAGEDRLLFLYKQVCRKYFNRYPEMVASHIYMWRDVYDDREDDCEG